MINNQLFGANKQVEFKKVDVYIFDIISHNTTFEYKKLKILWNPLSDINNKLKLRVKIIIIIHLNSIKW